MAIFHLSARNPIARAAGRSATAAAAYRAGASIYDLRTGLTFDYSRRHGVLGARIYLPGGRLVTDREVFWNSVEEHHRRRDAVVAREVVVALPAELGPRERAQLAFDFARQIADEFGVAVDCVLHAPSRDGDDRNFHAHLLITACGISADGALGMKVERLDPIACRRAGVADSVSWMRPHWQDLVNAALASKGSVARVDHRSLRARGIERHATVHVGKGGATARSRSNLNLRLQRRNVRVKSLEMHIDQLLLMRAQLAAKSEIDVRFELGASPISAIRIKLAQSLARESDRSSDLIPWRRRKERQSNLQTPTVAAGSTAGASTDARSAAGRPRQSRLRYRP